MNYEYILQLLKIMSLANEWPEFRAIHDSARAELLEANVEAQAYLAQRAKDKATAEQEAKAKQVAKDQKANQAQASVKAPIGTTVRPDFAKEEEPTTFSSDAGAPPAVDRRL